MVVSRLVSGAIGAKDDGAVVSNKPGWGAFAHIGVKIFGILFRFIAFRTASPQNRVAEAFITNSPLLSLAIIESEVPLPGPLTLPPEANGLKGALAMLLSNSFFATLGSTPV